MEMSVVVHNRKSHTKKHLTIDISVNDTVKSVEDKISTLIGIPTKELSIILCGRVLEDSTLIKDLMLGPTTSLVALIVEHESNQSNSSTSLGSSDLDAVSFCDTSLIPNTPEIGSFYVWCKTCSDVQQGKLRVYCSCCSSTAAIVKTEPSCWTDVMKGHRIRVECEDCFSEEAYASFKFKCVNCGEVGAPLSHIRGNWEQMECCICTDPYSAYVFDLGCMHITCKNCFQRFISTSLLEAKFSFKPPYGYTVTCPFSDCERCVIDVHHFHIMGLDMYQLYQRIATEKLIALDSQGVFCPYPDCNSSFFWETFDDEGKISCPDCFRLFCRKVLNYIFVMYIIIILTVVDKFMSFFLVFVRHLNVFAIQKMQREQQSRPRQRNVLVALLIRNEMVGVCICTVSRAV